ncbi:hypothetical protein [Nocardia sp. NBC_01327]|uniref:hypothetical protein n=1 Tax=Nocardia sp. NBC_01327 TaxID=2903593 RepID=UPI002E0F2081|nr:hypothetical protein OG326_02955 [Nocardia sp. NBC_01327]
MTGAGVGLGELAGRTGLPEVLLAGRLAAPEYLRVDELVMIAAATKRDVVELLPCSRGPAAAGCNACGDAVE